MGQQRLVSTHLHLSLHPFIKDIEMVTYLVLERIVLNCLVTVQSFHRIWYLASLVSVLTLPSST